MNIKQYETLNELFIKKQLLRENLKDINFEIKKFKNYLTDPKFAKKPEAIAQIKECLNILNKQKTQIVKELDN